jgi:5'(3')-deoxyribonucleotidase
MKDELRRLRLGIDLDGVVGDFHVGWMTRYNARFGTELQASQVQDWDGLHELTHFRTMDEFWEWAREGETSIFRDIPPYERAVETIADLSRHHRIVIISSKFDWAIPDTLAWMAEHRIIAHEIHFVWDKTTVACDVYLEDAPHNLTALRRHRGGAVVCRMVRAWNSPLEGAVDITDWRDFATLVQSHAEDPAFRSAPAEVREA